MALMNIETQEQFAPTIRKDYGMRVQHQAPLKESHKINGVPHKEMDRFEALGKTFPNGCLFRFQIKAEIFDINNVSNFWEHVKLTYASSSWEKISNIPLYEAMQKNMLLFGRIYSDDLAEMYKVLHQSFSEGTVFNTEIRYRYSNTETRWYRISTQPRREGDLVVCDGLLLDVTKRKKDEIELAMFRKALEPLIKDRSDELEATKEELTSVKRELERKNVQLHNEILAHMKVVQKLENMNHTRRTSSPYIN